MQRKEGETFKIVHITDVHYDPRYVVGNNGELMNFLQKLQY